MKQAIKAIMFYLVLSAVLSCDKKDSDDGISADVQTVVDSLSILKGVQTDFKNVPRYQALLLKANLKELIALTDYPKPTIRCYAYIALIEKDYPDIHKVFYKHQNDSSLVTSGQGCIIATQSVASFMIEQLNPRWAKTKYRFSQKEFQKIKREIEKRDEILIEKNQTESDKRLARYFEKRDSIIKLYKHENLLYDQQYRGISHSGDPDFNEKRKLVSKPLKIQEFDGNALVTAYFEVNDCNEHFPNIIRKGDSIIVFEQVLDKSPCDVKSTRIDKVNFFIENKGINKAKTVIAMKQASH
jgi:hypothetical protein